MRSAVTHCGAGVARTGEQQQHVAVLITAKAQFHTLCVILQTVIPANGLLKQPVQDTPDIAPIALLLFL